MRSRKLLLLKKFYALTFFFNFFSVPPTAVWVNKKDQHLLAGKEAVYNCGSTGASPRSKFSWMLGEKIINGNEIPLHQVVIQFNFLFFKKLQ